MRRKEHVLADVDPYHARDATREEILWSGSIRIKQSLKVGKKIRFDLYAVFGKSCLVTRVPSFNSRTPRHSPDLLVQYHCRCTPAMTEQYQRVNNDDDDAAPVQYSISNRP